MEKLNFYFDERIQKGGRMKSTFQEYLLTKQLMIKKLRRLFHYLTINSLLKDFAVPNSV